MSDRVVICIGTKKGVFVAEGSKTRKAFALRGPFAPGVAVYSALIDKRGTPRIYASSCNAFFGMKVLRSTDLGKKFKETKSAPAFPKDDGRALANIWSLEPGDTKKDLWCGVEPASLFRSSDGGDSWELVPGISNHEHARKWQPGNGGLCMHTILRDGNRMHLGISTGGHYVSEDGGQTFQAANNGVGAGFTPDPFPEFGQCVHKIAGHKDAPGRLYMQNHGGWGEWDGPGGRRPDIGVLRSDDHGRTWRSIAKGLPSDFGFPIVVHPHDPDTVYVMPHEGWTRACPAGIPAVWRSENGGESWTRSARGLPKKDSYFTVQRDGMVACFRFDEKGGELALHVFLFLLDVAKEIAEHNCEVKSEKVKGKSEVKSGEVKSEPCSTNENRSLASALKGLKMRDFEAKVAKLVFQKPVYLSPHLG